MQKQGGQDMSRKIYAAKLPRVIIALCMVMCLSFAFLSVNAFADNIIIVGGSDNSDTTGGTTTGGTTTNTGSVVVVGGNNNGGNVAVTKSPTSETVEKGGAATFVARADNATGFVWRLVSPDASNTINAKAAPNEFSGLWVDGTDSDTLTLGNIPESMNGWYVECKFEGNGGPVFTNGAKITVSGATGTTNNPGTTGNQASNTTAGDDKTAPVLPTITSQPKGTSLQKGQVTSLSVTATTTDDSTLNYQWYASSTNSTTSGTPIAGAISAQYQPPEKEGSTFYYVAVWGTKGGQTGTKIFSTPVEVTYAAGSNNAAVGNTTGGQLVIDAGPTGNNTINQPSGANSGSADRVGTPSANNAANATANNTAAESEDDGSTAVVMLVIALVALVACLGLVVKSGLLTRK